MIIRLATFIAATWAILSWDQRRRAREQQAQLDQPRGRVKPTEVTTWEGEGGALPTAGAQTGAAPEQR
jgi:hypothetical protein